MRSTKTSTNMTGNQNKILEVSNLARTNLKKNHTATKWTARQMASETTKTERKLLRRKKTTKLNGIKVTSNAVTHFSWMPLLCALPAAINVNSPTRKRIAYSQRERLLIELLLSRRCMRCTPHVLDDWIQIGRRRWCRYSCNFHGDRSRIYHVRDHH